MAQSAPTAREHEWLAYYEQFRYFSPVAVRDGSQPRIREHEPPSAKSIVLVHGLSDSPYFMTAIADYFFGTLGYNVYLPLLQSHGLKDPQGMEGVALAEWKANVRFAIQVAAARSPQVSIGGLSTGGALSFYMAAQQPSINGAVYLFSAALDLLGPALGPISSYRRGQLREWLLRTFLADLFDKNTPALIGVNPYRYARLDYDGARELARLIKETDTLIHGFRAAPFAKPIFAAHSESDTTASLAGIEALQKVCVPQQFTLYRIPQSLQVAHASLVLKEPVYALHAQAGEEPLEKANPQFQAMMAEIGAWTRHKNL